MVSTAARRLKASSLPVGWSPSAASAVAFLLVAVSIQPPRSMLFVSAQSDVCDTSGSGVEGVEGVCSISRPMQCCNGNCIPRSGINDGYDGCGDGSDETAVPFSQCAAERATTPIGMRTVVAVICRGTCSFHSRDGDSCHANDLTKVPTFVNKDVTDVDLSYNSIAVIDAGAFSGLPLLTTLHLFGNSITAIDAGTFSGLPLLTTLYLGDNSVAVIDAGTFSNLPLLTTLDLSWNSIAVIDAGTFAGLPLLTTLHLFGNSITAIDAGTFSGLPLLTTLYLGDNSVAVIDAGTFSDLPSLTTLDLYRNSIAVIETGAFSGLPLLTTLYLSDNSVAVIDAGTFSDLPSLTTLELSSNSIAVIDAGAFLDLPSLPTVDLSWNSIAVIEAGAFSDLPLLTTLDLRYNPLTTYDYSQMDGVKELCEAANAAQTLLSADPLCSPSYKSPGESAFIAVSAGASATVGLAVLAVLWQVRRNAARASTEDDTVDEDTGTLTRWDAGHVLFITFRIFDLLTDYGVIGFTSKQPSWEEAMTDTVNVYSINDELRDTEYADPIKYISLTSAIIGTLLFIPDLSVFARKLGLAQEIGGVFNWYKPTRKAAMVIMVSTLLLESIPQLVCSYIIIDQYSSALDSYEAVTLPIISAIMTATTIVSDAFFLAKLCCGRARCCSCCCTCCHCDVSDLFDDGLGGTPAAAGDSAAGTNTVTITNPSFAEAPFGGSGDNSLV